MTKAEILTEIRVLLNEAAEGFFLDTQINNWIDQAAVDISSKTGCYEQTDIFDTEDGTIEYAEATGCIKTHFCIRNGCYKLVPHFDNTNWDPVAVNWTWDGTKWVAQATMWYPTLCAIGAWPTAFRPTRVRITFTPSPDYMKVADGTNFAHYVNESYISGTEVDLDWSDQDGHVMTDIYGLTVGFEPSAVRSITNIEFYDLSPEYRGFIKAHPRLAGHVGDAMREEPSAWYHDHNKIGLLPVSNGIYPVKTFYSKVTEDITKLPVQYQPYAILYGLQKGLLKDKQRDSAKMIEAIYLNNLLFHRQDLSERQVDSEDMFKLGHRLLKKQ